LFGVRRSPIVERMTNTRTSPTLVLGATGKTGRRVLERLQARALPVRAGSRSAQPPFDWDDDRTWAPVLDGVGAVYISYFPDLAVPGASTTVLAFAEAAVAAGVERLVLLSGRGEEEALASEQLVQGLDVASTIVRASWFNQNFSESYLLDAIVQGAVFLPATDVPEPFVDAEDIADVAVAALTEDGHAGQVYEVTGPRLLTFAEAVAEIAKATNRPLTFSYLPAEEYAAAMAAEGQPADVIELITYLFTTVLDGRNASVTDGVRRALGREPRDFYDYAWDTACAGVWDER
jgi:uncharacterized protein YbjT (DUF2867 family)